MLLTTDTQPWADTETRRFKQQHSDGTVTEGIYDGVDFVALSED